ncbi:cyclic-di-AMP receptor [Schnuerera sp. xch1]|uniref:cyclic-di-AMP receptor n=1 Tax=Schnuerera sp. xch1 TaxID=2874283 RepID=UPI001CC1BD74|nr:cyclic-di-AMP receptor [Schnuerera sp. xch1]MBZ2175054.1 cyclic-di-AMP receptor [Schnuerera sp. xch1]
MKLIIAIIEDDYSQKVIKSLMDEKYRTTKLSSTGGFLKSGNTTLLIGVEDDDVDKVVKLIQKQCKEKNVNNGKDKITVGGANLFILNMHDYKRI